jgi:hypothetical protein
LAGEVKKVTDVTAGTSFSTVYDNVGRVSAVNTVGYNGSTEAFASQIHHRAGGMIKSMVYGNNTTLNIGYNSRGQMANYSINGVLDQSAQTVTIAVAYQYHADGQVKWAQDQAATNSIRDRAYNYDHAGRLAEALSGTEARNFVNNTTGGPTDGPYRQTSTYDAWDNTVTQAGPAEPRFDENGIREGLKKALSNPDCKKLVDSLLNAVATKKNPLVTQYSQGFSLRTLPRGVNNEHHYSGCRVYCGFITIVSLVQQAGWRGIVPLHSTREEVERLVGPPMMPGGITYDLKTERLNVVYSIGGCREAGAEWDVAPATVMGMTVYPQKRLMLSDLNIDLNRFEEFINPHTRDSISYSNREEGLAIVTRLNGEVIVFEYFPRARDGHLHCPKTSTGLSNDKLQYFKFDEYSNLSLNDEKARLNNFAIRLQGEPTAKGYILAYASRLIRPRAALARAKRARAYLIKRWHVEAIRLETRLAGSREKATYEIYLVPKSVENPSSKSQ